MKTFLISLQLVCWLALGIGIKAQTKTDTAASLKDSASLNTCIQYALRHQPLVQQSLIDQDITERQIRTRLADWYPQVTASYNLQHNFQLPTAYAFGNYVQNGTYNTSALGVGATQNIFNRDVLLASRTASDVRRQATQVTTSNKIDVTVNVSKAFYDVLLTQMQVGVLDEDIARLERSLKDAYNQYRGGLVDKTDYKRATISLNNAKAQRKQTFDQVAAKYAYLKQLMGYPVNDSLLLQFDSTQMEKQVFIDTSLTVSYQNRIEYQQLQTQQRLLQANLQYYKWGYLPSVYAYGAYNLGYLNNDFAHTYSSTYPNSNIGLTLSVPIFQGTKRIQQVKAAELELKRNDWDFTALKSNINTEYQQAIAGYKGSLANYYALKDNMQLAADVYNTIRLQYTSGIKTYLDVIVAEADLRSAQLNYYNALSEVLQSKIDVQRALGTIQY